MAYTCFYSATLHFSTVQQLKDTWGDWDRMLRVSNQIYRLQLQPILHDPHALVERLRGKAQGQMSLF